MKLLKVQKCEIISSFEVLIIRSNSRQKIDYEYSVMKILQKVFLSVLKETLTIVIYWTRYKKVFAKSPIDHVTYHVHCTNRLKTTRSRRRKPRREEIPRKEKNRLDENLRNSSNKF